MLRCGFIKGSMRYDKGMKTLTQLGSKTLIALLSFFVLFLSSEAFAAEANKETLQGYIVSILQFINFILLPLLFAIALLFFLVNMARYFILKGDNGPDREKAKTLALYGIGAFVFLVSIWGIVNMFVNGLEINNEGPRCPDYLGDWCEGPETIYI